MTARPPKPDMTFVRTEIDRIDKALTDLLAERAELIDLATTIKHAAGIPARTTDRVAQVLENARSNAAATGLEPDLAERIWHVLIDWSIAREETVLGETV